MNEPWNTTQAKLKKWQDNPSPWELRRILSESDHFKVIASNALRRAKANPKKYGAVADGVTWLDWWGHYLEKLSERDAVGLLLDVWNKDVWNHRNALTKAQAHEIIGDILRSARSPAPQDPADLLRKALLGLNPPAGGEGGEVPKSAESDNKNNPGS